MVVMVFCWVCVVVVLWFCKSSGWIACGYQRCGSDGLSSREFGDGIVVIETFMLPC